MDTELEPVKTTIEIHNEYKTQAPKFDEKIDAGDTEDLVAWYQQRKPITVKKFNCTMFVLWHTIVLCIHLIITLHDGKLLYYAQLRCSRVFCTMLFVLCSLEALLV